MHPVTEKHLRALMACTPRSVLVRNPAGSRLEYADPASAHTLLTKHGYTLVITRGDLRDSGVCAKTDGSLAAGSVAAIRRVLRDLAEDGHPVKERRRDPRFSGPLSEER